MEISDFTLRIILLFIPGIVCMTIVNQLVEYEEQKIFDYIVKTLICSFLAYSLVSVCAEIIDLIIYILHYYSLTNYTSDLKVIFLDCLTNKELGISFFEIIITSVLSIPLAFFISWFLNKKKLFRIAQDLHCSNKFGDIDVWSYIFNSDKSFYVVIRDHDHNLMYQGFATAFSKSHKDNELLLLNVSVYTNNEATHLYDIDMMYITRDSSNLTIEFRGIEESIGKEKK